ncbi:UNVERIFIED_CONTAM: hypothetical protein FKN15_065662 [Acipenser sinensis]
MLHGSLHKRVHQGAGARVSQVATPNAQTSDELADKASETGRAGWPGGVFITSLWLRKRGINRQQSAEKSRLSNRFQLNKKLTVVTFQRLLGLMGLMEPAANRYLGTSVAEAAAVCLSTARNAPPVPGKVGVLVQVRYPHPVKPLSSSVPLDEKRQGASSVPISVLEKLKSTMRPVHSTLQGQHHAEGIKLWEAQKIKQVKDDKFGRIVCQWRTTRTRTVPSPHGSDVTVENHPYPYCTDPSRVGCASGEPPIPVLYRALTGRMCQWRTTHTRTVPIPHGSDVTVVNHPYPYCTDPSRVGCASGEPPIPVLY